VTATVGSCLGRLDAAYDPRLAEEWDSVGLVCGDPEAAVTRVHVAVDPTLAVAREAVAAGAQLLVTHHPLLLRAVHSVAATSPAGRVVHELIRGGTALVAVHTNADVASPGVSDALAATLGIGEVEPLLTRPAGLETLVTYVPAAGAPELLDALARAGAGRIGRYDRCAFSSPGTGTFRPLTGARPAIGAVGAVEQVEEVRLELALAPGSRDAVVAALRAAHPYEEPAFSVTATLTPARHGLGRVGVLAADTTLGELAARTAALLPATAAGVRASAPPEHRVRRVAVCGGAGLETAEAAVRAGADVLVTADARHHTGLDAPLAILDVAHWASEWPWCAQAAEVLAEEVGADAVTVSTLVTDPWRLHVAAADRAGGGGPCRK
jgi:dinuclear metal center YbgI/SA1388 family protein